MKWYEPAVNWVIRSVFGILCKLDMEELQKVPQKGPLILVANHVNFLEVPVVRAYLQGRNITGLAKVETLNNPLLNFLFNTWGAISIERGTVDRKALSACTEALDNEMILAIAPEGTRSGSGVLQQGKAGTALIAARSGAPLLPLVYWGGEQFWDNLKHLRRTPFHVCVGKPFVIELKGESLSKDVRQRITDEMMYKLAELLPEQYHGLYAHPERELYLYLRDI